MATSPRCLYSSSFAQFNTAEPSAVFGVLCEKYHREAWTGEIAIMKRILAPYSSTDGQIIFEYDIPRLGKRIDVVLLLNGIVFCLEFKVGQSSVLEADVDQVLDYALDRKNFHKLSEDRIIVPILIATNYKHASTLIQPSVYDDSTDR